MSRMLLVFCASALTLVGSGAPNTTIAAGATRSIRDFTDCDGRSDDTQGLQAAFTAAAHNAFTLVIDCPVSLHIADDIARPIFVDSGTRVQFSRGGQLVVDNSGIPAFVIANSSDVHFLGWRILYTGQTPVQKLVTGYHRDHQWVAKTTAVGGEFNNAILTPWMAKNRRVVMSNGHDLWSGTTNSTAIFFLTGDDSGIEVRDMAVSTADAAHPAHYVPMVFSFTTGFYSGTSTPKASGPAMDRPAVPHDLVFDHIDLDGTLMGFQGTMRDATFSHIRSHHYADLQGDDGNMPGGEGKWFAPPHLFYIVGSGPVQPQHIRISDVVDDGLRVGRPRDTQTDKGSGYALSLKIGGNDVVVDGYVSHRPDGFLDVLASNGLTVRNAEATYDSHFLNDIYPGVRFVAGAPGYTDVTLENVHLTDTSPRTRVAPVSNNNVPTNSGVVFHDVRVDLNDWAGPAPLSAPAFAGNHNSTPVTYTVRTRSGL